LLEAADIFRQLAPIHLIGLANLALEIAGRLGKFAER